MAKSEMLKLPDHFELEPELREQLGTRPGHQRCVEGHDEMLLIVHEVPKPRTSEREALFFWKRMEGRWAQVGGPGLSGLSELLDRYETVIDAHEQVIDSTASAGEIFATLRHAAPLARAVRNLEHALEQALAIEPDDRDLRNLRDRAKDLERAADLLQADARVTLEFWSAQRVEEQARASEGLGKTVRRLTLLAGFFLPIVSIGGLLGMNMDFHYLVRPLFWLICISGLMIGGLLLRLVGRQGEASMRFQASQRLISEAAKIGKRYLGKQ